MPLQALAAGAVVATMMLATGLRLDPRRLEGPSRRAHLFAAAANLVLLPVLTWAAAKGLALSPGHTVGLLLCAVTPGGPVGVVFATLARAHLGSATGLVVMWSALGVLTAPSLLGLLAPGTLDTTALIWPMTQSLLLWQLLPLAVGMAAHAARPAAALAGSVWVSRLSNLFLAVLGSALLWLKSDVLLAVPLGAHAFSIGSSALLIWAGARLEGGDRGQSLELTTAARNVGSALLISSAWFTDPAVDATVMAVGLYTVVVPVSAALWWSRPGPAPRRA